MDNIRVGIVGATVTKGGSGWGALSHVPALHAAPGVELKAVCTSREETARDSAEAFGASLAFHDVHDMAVHPEVDLVAVCVRVPGHHDLVVAGIDAGKPVLCEWPLGANLDEARAMADAARSRSLRTMVGLQGRSDPTLRHVRDLVADGYVGEVLVAGLTLTAHGPLERGPERIWQAERKNGANLLTIDGGHAMDALCFILGEFASVSARLATRTTRWRNSDTGEQVPVTAPDSITVAGRLVGGSEVSVQVAAVPSTPGGGRLEIHGSEGSLVVTALHLQLGPHRVLGARGTDLLEELVVPPHAGSVVDRDLPTMARNVANAYARIAETCREGEPYHPDFDDAVERHRLLDAIERSATEERSVAL